MGYARTCPVIQKSKWTCKHLTDADLYRWIGDCVEKRLFLSDFAPFNFNNSNATVNNVKMAKIITEYPGFITLTCRGFNTYNVCKIRVFYQDSIVLAPDISAKLHALCSRADWSLW